MEFKSGVEIERKYIIAIPALSDMQRMEGYRVSDIEQIYLESSLATHRIRRREYADRCVYTETVKHRIDGMSAVEEEREIDAREYASLKEKIAVGSHPVCKKRHEFIYKGQLFEIDIYPFWRGSCIMETELETRLDSPQLPPFIRIIREVTGDKRYSNASLSRALMPEENLSV
ncbi:MAG: hypothetical protein IJX97_03760 [Clostridia bacterium]|nr:hypothetical protein [Clostridia bacterium]MBQ8720282.1 hypothetical protein [Clostridia bacterium]